MAQVYRVRILGRATNLDRQDAVIMFHRGKSFEHLQQSLNDIENDAVLLSVAMWILFDVSCLL
jgi:hypothetical protein